MFFILSKLLLFLFSPFNWFVIALLIYFFYPKDYWKKKAKISAFVLFLFFSNTVIFLECCGLWEVQGTQLKDVKNYEVGIVLGGMSEYNNDLNTLSLRRGGDRIWQALTLYKKGKIKKILISGDSGYVTDRGLHEAKQLKEVLVSWGIPEQDILTETRSKNTHENARETKRLLQRSHPHVETSLLITSGIHMKRALACFEKEGMKCDPFSTDLYSGPKHNYFWEQYLVPDVSTFYDWERLMKEYIGFITYKIMGYA